MNTLRAIAEALKHGRKDKSDVDLAKKTGLTRQSISRALSSNHNFNVNTLLAIAEANGQEVLIVPKGVARAFFGVNQPPVSRIEMMIDGLKDL